MKKIGPSI